MWRLILIILVLGCGGEAKPRKQHQTSYRVPRLTVSTDAFRYSLLEGIRDQGIVLKHEFSKKIYWDNTTPMINGEVVSTRRILVDGLDAVFVDGEEPYYLIPFSSYHRIMDYYNETAQNK